jgi:hypothetical protein
VDEWRPLRSLLVGGRVLPRVRKQRRNSSVNKAAHKAQDAIACWIEAAVENGQDVSVPSPRLVLA